MHPTGCSTCVTGLPGNHQSDCTEILYSDFSGQIRCQANRMRTPIDALIFETNTSFASSRLHPTSSSYKQYLKPNKGDSNKNNKLENFSKKHTTNHKSRQAVFKALNVWCCSMALAVHWCFNSWTSSPNCSSSDSFSKATPQGQHTAEACWSYVCLC